jgi:hypothetical protein
MVFKMVGADQAGNFPTRVETAIRNKIKVEVTTDGKDTKELLDGIFAPITGSTAYAPASGSANYAPAEGSTKYASLDGTGKVPSSQLPAQTVTLRTAYVNFPPIWEKVTTTTSGSQTQGVQFVCTTAGTVKKVRAKINSVSAVTYTIGIYEVSPTDRITITAIAGQATFTETANTAGKILDLTINAPLVAGKYYVLAISASTNSLTTYYNNAGGLYHSAVSATMWEGTVDPQRNFAGVPIVGSVFGRGSDYVTVGMSVDY